MKAQTGTGRGRSSRASGAACECAGTGERAQRAAAAVAGSIGAGGVARGVDPKIKDANLRHLRRIEGQVRGIAAMIEQDRYCADIITQVAAVRESLHAVARNLMRNHIRHCATDALRSGGDPASAMVDELLELVGKVAR